MNFFLRDLRESTNSIKNQFQKIPYMSWYDPFKLKRRKWSERSPTGKKIYVIYYLILVSVLGVILWIGEFSEEAQTRDQQNMLEWEESRRKEALKENKSSDK